MASSSTDFEVLHRIKLLTEYGAFGEAQEGPLRKGTKGEPLDTDTVGYDPTQRESRGTAISAELLREYGLSLPEDGVRRREQGTWQLYRILSGSHRGWIRTIAVDPTNHWFISGGNDSNIKVWDLASGELMQTFKGHSDAVRAVVIDQDRPYFYSAAEDKQVRSWDLTTNQVSRHFYGHGGGVYALAKHPQLDLLVSGGRDLSVRVWDLRSARQVIELPGHTAPVLSLACQADEPQIISGAADHRVRLWDIVAGRASAILTHHQSSVRGLCIHKTEWAFSSASAESVRQWQCPRGDLLRNFVDPLKQRNGPNIIHALSVNDSDHLVAAGENGLLSFWDWDTGHCFQQIVLPLAPGSLPSETSIFGVAFDQTGHRLIAGCADKTIKILRLQLPATVADDNDDGEELVADRPLRLL